jgi:gamma-glutamyltranspeptidase/glutathione hydrolase
MSLAFADRDFYYGDPYFPPEEPVRGLLSKEYAASARASSSTPTATTRTSSPAIPTRSRAGPTRTSTCCEVERDAARTPATQDTAPPRSLAAKISRAFRGHDLDRGGGRGGLGGLGHAERRLGAGGHRGQDRRRPQPARAELRADEARESVQRDRAGQAPARDAHADARAEGRQARISPSPCRAATRRTRTSCSSSSNVVEFGMTCRRRPRRRTSTASRCAAPSARTSRGRAASCSRADAALGAHELRRMGYDADLRGAHLRPDQRDPVDREHGTMWGGSSNHGEDYGIAW